MTTDGYGIGTIPVTGCVTDRLTLANVVPADQVPDIIERDRVLMAARPGMHQKLLPILAEPGEDTVLSGGAYLFDSLANAEDFAAWVANDFELDGVLFADRDMFLECSAKVWQVLAAENFHDPFTRQGLMRVEEWRLADGIDRARLEGDWPAMRDEAVAAGLTSAWLLCNEAAAEVSLVTAAPSQSSGGTEPQADTRGLAALAALPSLGRAFESGPGSKIFDRTSFIYSVWFPVTGAAGDKPPLFPNSPPLPTPMRLL